MILADTKFEFGVDPLTGEVVLRRRDPHPGLVSFLASGSMGGRRNDPRVLISSTCATGWCPRNPVGIRSASLPSLPEEVVQATRDRYIAAFQLITGEEPQL